MNSLTDSQVKSPVIPNHLCKEYRNEIDEPLCPIFAFKEFNTHYLLTLDLPGIEGGEFSIEANQNNLRIINGGKNVGMHALLFHCQSSGQRIRASYQGGVLYMTLPKNSFVDLIDLPRLKKFMS